MSFWRALRGFYHNRPIWWAARKQQSPIPALFRNGESGAWIDLNALALLYTTSAGTTNVAAVNDPIGRAERKAGTNHALNATTTQRPLLRKWPHVARRNLIYYSQQFSASTWIKSSVTITENATTAPDGTLTADKIVETTATAIHQVYQGYYVGIPVTARSMWAKPAERNHIYFASDGGGSVFEMIVSLETGEIVAASGGSITSFSAVPDVDGWWKITFVWSPSSGSSIFRVGPSDGVNFSYTGDASKGIYLWGAQLEPGATATTYQRVDDVVYDAGNRYYAYHDRVDDKLTLNSMPAGTYTIGFASFAGVFVYQVVLDTTGTLSLPGADYTELFIVNRVLTDAETAAVTRYLLTKTPLIGSDDIFRLYSATNSVNLSITEAGGSSGATWELGNGQTASGASCVKTIAAPQSVILRATDPSKIQVIDWSTKSLFGQIKSLSRLTGLTEFYYNNNQITCSIPSLSNNTGLTIFYCHNNQLTDFSGGTVSATLGDFQAQNNLLSASAVNAILAAFVAANKTTGTRVLNLGGTGNAAPTGQGITDKATLVSRGWTVTTN